jgi:3-oxoacyl-[acyl-carrier protein] reductase
MSLSNKTALVTGSSRGIGRAIALELARQGADVAINCASRVTEAEQVKREIEGMGRRALVVQGNVSDPEAVDEMAREITRSLGNVDILINNAGVTRDNLLLRMKEVDWDTVLDVNLKAAFLCAKTFSRQMLKSRWGRIINISSVVGLRGNPGQANYCAAKAGLLGMTKSLARELGSRNITVNAVAPGFITTEMTAQLPREREQEMLQQVPANRLGTPEDVASVVSFLAGDAAGYVTGQVIAVDGGMSM